MIRAMLRINYIGPNGWVFSDRPDCKEMQTGWKKEWRLLVDVDGGRYFSQHMEILTNGRAEDPEFNEYIKKALAKNVGNIISDVISSQI